MVDTMKINRVLILTFSCENMKWIIRDNLRKLENTVGINWTSKMHAFHHLI